MKKRILKKQSLQDQIIEEKENEADYICKSDEYLTI
jgi:hypothetical protein